MKCSDCPFFWKEENEDFPCCHFETRTCWDVPPCEEENNEYEEETW